jgi:hypothetical protein
VGLGSIWHWGAVRRRGPEPLPGSEVTKFPCSWRVSPAKLASAFLAITPLAQRGSGAAAGGGLEPGEGRRRSLRKHLFAGACGRRLRELPARSKVRSWRRQRRSAAAAGAGRRSQVRQSARGRGPRRARGGLSVPQQPRGPPPGSTNKRVRRRHVLAAAAAAAAEAKTGAASATRAAAAAAAAAGLRSRRRGRTRWRRRRSGSGDRAQAERGSAGRLWRSRRLRGGPSRAGGG